MTRCLLGPWYVRPHCFWYASWSSIILAAKAKHRLSLSPAKLFFYPSSPPEPSFSFASITSNARGSILLSEIHNNRLTRSISCPFCPVLKISSYYLLQQKSPNHWFPDERVVIQREIDSFAGFCKILQVHGRSSPRSCSRSVSVLHPYVLLFEIG